MILAPDSSFGQNPVELRSGAEGTVVIPGTYPKVAAFLSEYQDRIVEIDTPGSPPEVSAKDPRIMLQSTYKSGIVLRPVRTVYAYASGRIVKPTGAPVPWMYGRVESSDGRVVGELFTDETGRFEVYELGEGSYIIKWGSEELADVAFEVPPKTDGAIDLGTIGAAEKKGDPK